MAICKCTIGREVTNFVDFCINNDDNICKETMKHLESRWKQEREMERLEQQKINLKDKIKIHDEQLSICTKTYLDCEDCKKKVKTREKHCKHFVGTNYNGKVSAQENCSWHELNIKIVLGAIAAGIGPTDVLNLLTFMDLPIPTSFSAQTFSKI